MFSFLRKFFTRKRMAKLVRFEGEPDPRAKRDHFLPDRWIGRPYH